MRLHLSLYLWPYLLDHRHSGLISRATKQLRTVWTIPGSHRPAPFLSPSSDLHPRDQIPGRAEQVHQILLDLDRTPFIRKRLHQ